MKVIRILFTGVGRRVELIQAFRQAANCLNVDLKIYGADVTGTAPALMYCDYSRKVCSMREPQYIEQLLNICMEDTIDLLIPTIDTDLLILAQNRERFLKNGTKVLVSASDKVMICRDKNNTGVFFESCGLKAPKSYNNYKEYFGTYPCFIKPKDGSSSINAFKVNDAEELEMYATKIGDYVIQPFVEGREFTIDIFCDYEGNPIYITPRERLQVRAGEVLKTQIHMDRVMVDESRKIIEKFRPCGPITVQLIQDKVSGDNYYIEINPRYGGGVPLSMKAGARSAEVLLNLVMGKKVNIEKNYDCDGAIYSRFDQSVCISVGNDMQPIKGVIFDLDDTLYSEKQYIKNGYKKIGEFLENEDAESKLWNYFLEGKPAIDAYLEEINETDKKTDCLKIYREQIPKIKLYDGVLRLIYKLKNKGIKVGIITDGRPEGQRNKLKALGLDEIIDDIIITDELGGTQFRKPNDISFRIMQNRWRLPYEQIIYVGDNLNKDFQAPQQLGMRYLHFGNEDGLYFCGERNCVSSIESIESYLL